MSDDTVPPPVGSPEGLILYRGRWLTETRESVELKGASNSILREIWIKLPSGKDKRWRTNEKEFSALEGHQVGAVVRAHSSGEESLLGMINYDTGEARLFWFHPRGGCGCLIWMAWLFCAGFLRFATEKVLYAWATAFIILVIFSIRENSSARKFRATKERCLEALKLAGPAARESACL